MKATLSNFHQSPRKVTLVAGAIRGKSVTLARNTLAMLPQKSSAAIRKLLESAVANARSKGADESTLFVQTIGVDKGSSMRRFRPMSRGRAAAFRRTMSHVTLVLGEKSVPTKKSAKKGTNAQPAAKKTVAKKTVAKKTTKKSAPVTNA